MNWTEIGQVGLHAKTEIRFYQTLSLLWFGKDRQNWAYPRHVSSSMIPQPPASLQCRNLCTNTEMCRKETLKGTIVLVHLSQCPTCVNIFVQIGATAERMNTKHNHIILDGRHLSESRIFVQIQEYWGRNKPKTFDGTVQTVPQLYIKKLGEPQHQALHNVHEDNVISFIIHPWSACVNIEINWKWALGGNWGWTIVPLFFTNAKEMKTYFAMPVTCLNLCANTKI